MKNARKAPKRKVGVAKRKKPVRLGLDVRNASNDRNQADPAIFGGDNPNKAPAAKPVRPRRTR